MKRANGFSLVELMVAMAIGSILVIGASLVFEVNRATYVRQTAVGGLQTEARYAMELLGRELRETGFRRMNWTVGPIPNALAATNNTTGAVDGSGPDQLQVRYAGLADCAGAPLAAGAFVVNTFALVGNQLRCNATPLVEGVEDFQVFFGEDTDGDGVANRTVAPGTAGFNPRRAVFVRVHLLMLSEVTSVVNPRPQTYFYSAANAGVGAARTVADGRVRREYVTTIAIRNLI
ncbi:MAG: PilW family protein [Gammaproteobacteria bacterium]